jgi:diguanylate cyclase (GGDEF)-like protein
MDLDHFKQVNDRFGHDVGDEVLRRVAGVIAHNCRSSDQAVRYGGEEFVLGLASVDYEDAVQIAHRVRASVQAQPWQDVAQELAVSVSIGIASAREASEAAALLTLADKRLYAAKYAGRNQVVMAG